MPDSPVQRSNLPTQWYRASRCNYVYICVVEATGIFDLGPFGWSVDKPGVGLYTINHNIGNTNFYANVRPASGATYTTVATVQSQTNSTIGIALYTSSALADYGFELLVVTPQ